MWRARPKTSVKAQRSKQNHPMQSDNRNDNNQKTKVRIAHLLNASPLAESVRLIERPLTDFH
jgi:hypothetical protein